MESRLAGGGAGAGADGAGASSCSMTDGVARARCGPYEGAEGWCEQQEREGVHTVHASNPKGSLDIHYAWVHMTDPIGTVKKR